MIPLQFMPYCCMIMGAVLRLIPCFMFSWPSKPCFTININCIKKLGLKCHCLCLSNCSTCTHVGLPWHVHGCDHPEAPAPVVGSSADRLGPVPACDGQVHEAHAAHRPPGSWPAVRQHGLQGLHGVHLRRHGSVTPVYDPYNQLELLILTLGSVTQWHQSYN